MDSPPIPAQITLAVEDYNRLVRMIQQGEKLKMTVDIAAEFHDGDLMGYNTVAEIPGADLKDEVVMVVQVDGRVRDRITVPADTGEDRCRELALASERARHALSGREIERVIVRAPRLVNVVTRR